MDNREGPALPGEILDHLINLQNKSHILSYLHQMRLKIFNQIEMVKILNFARAEVDVKSSGWKLWQPWWIVRAQEMEDQPSSTFNSPVTVESTLS